MQEDLQNKEHGVNMQRADKKLTLLECSLLIQAADAGDNGSEGNMPIPDKSKPLEAATQNNEAGANKQCSDKQLTLPESSECQSVQAVDVHDKGPEGNMPVPDKSKHLQSALQNIEQEVTMERCDNLILTGSDKCKSLQAAAQHNGSETILSPSEKSTKAVRRKKQSKKEQRSGKSKSSQINKESVTLTAAPKSSGLGDDSRDVWSKLGAMKCPHCGLVTSDIAVLNAHPCHRRSQQALKKRASPVSHSVSTDSSSFLQSKPYFLWKSCNPKAQYSGKRKLQPLRIAAPGDSFAETVMPLASISISEQHADVAPIKHSHLSEQQTNIAPFTYFHLTEQQANVAPIAHSQLTEQQANVAPIAHSHLTEQQANAAPIAHSHLTEQQANIAPIAHSHLTEQQANIAPIAHSHLSEENDVQQSWVISYDSSSDKYTCQTCNYSQMGNLFLEHVLCHAVEIPYSCMHCSCKFKTREDIRKHCNHEHSGLPARSSLNGVRIARNIMVKVKKSGKEICPLKYSDAEKISLLTSKLPAEITCSDSIERCEDSLAADLPTSSITSESTSFSVSAVSSVSSGAATDSQNTLSIPLNVLVSEPMPDYTSNDSCNDQVDVIKTTVNPSLTSSPTAEDLNVLSGSAGQVKDLSVSEDQHQQSQVCEHSQENGTSVNACFITGIDMQKKCDISEKCDNNLRPEAEMPELQIFSCEGNYVEHFAAGKQTSMCQTSESSTDNRQSSKISAKDKCDKTTFQANSATNSTDEVENDFDTVSPLTRPSICMQNNLRYILPGCEGVAREAPVHAPLSMPNQHLPVLPSMRPALASLQPSDKSVITSQKNNQNCFLNMVPHRTEVFSHGFLQTASLVPVSQSGAPSQSQYLVNPNLSATNNMRQLPLIIRKISPHPTNISLLTTEATRPSSSNQQYFLNANQSQRLPVNCTVNSNGGTMSTQPFALNSLQKNPSPAFHSSWMFDLRRLLASKEIPQASRESRGFFVAPSSTQSTEYAAAGGSLPGSTLYAQHATLPVMRQQAMTTSQNGTHTSNPSPFNLPHFVPSVVQGSTSLSSTSTTFSTTEFPVAGLHVPTVSGSASFSSSNSVLARISSASCNLAPYNTLPVIGPQTMTESSTATTPSLSISVTGGVAEVSTVSSVSTPSAIASTAVSSAEFTRTEAHMTNTLPSFSSLSFIKKEHLEPEDSVEACPSIALNTVDSRARMQTSPSTLDSGDSPAIQALKSYMMWNDQFVCLSCRKRFKEKQEFYSHVWNHQHPDREICQQCSFLDLDHVCQKTDETLKEIISNINLIDACILNHVGNPQIREKILKISTPGCCTEPVSIPDADLPVTESETPSTEIQKDNNLQNENNEPSSVCETDSVELAIGDTAVAETMNLGLSPQTMASSSVQACISLPVVDNIRSETTRTSGVNASDIGEPEEINKLVRECTRSKSTEDKTLTKDTVDHSKSKAEMINQKSRTYLCFVEAQSESGSKSCEHESGTAISWSSQSNVIQAASTESATDTVDHHCPTSAVVTESSALSQESSEGVPETELPPHDPTTSTVTENSPQVSKDLTGDVNPDTSIIADVSSRATKTDEATMDVPVFTDGDDVQFNVANRSSPKDVQEPGTLNDEGNSIDSTPFLSLIPNPSITMNTERRDSHLVTLTEPQRDDSLRTSPELVLDHLREESGALNATHTLLSSLEKGSIRKERGKHTLDSSTEIVVMEREEDISLPHGSKDKLSDEKRVSSDTNHVPSSLKETHSVQNPAMIAGNKLACENLLGGTITDRDKTEIETAAEESQYFEGESSSEMEIRPIASEPEVPSDKASSPKRAVLELSKPEKQNLEEGLDICSGGQPSCNADIEDHQLHGTENDICHEAQDECRKAAGDQLLEPEQTAFPEQRGQHISIEEASSADSDRLSKFYICSLCTFSCCLATDFTMHLNSCHDNEVDFVCYHCQYRGAYTTDLTNHITEHTISSALFWCPAETCTFRAESIRQLEPHIKAHSELVKCCCRTCKLSFASPTDLLNHFKEHSKTLFSCSRCPARFLSRAAIMHHCQQDHTGRCLFRVVGMLLCQQRMENGYEIFALHDMKLATETNEAMVEAASNSQDTNLTSINADSSTLEVISLSEPVCDSISRNILGTSCVGGDSIEYGSDQFKASKHISSQDSCSIKSPNPDESAGSKKAKSLRLRTENVSLVKGLLVEAVSSVRQEMCDKMGSIQDLDNKLTKEDSVSLHSVVSMPSTTVNAFVAEVDTPNNKQAENRGTGETSHEVLRQNQTKEEESHSDIPFVHSPTPIEPSLFSVAVPDATVADPASSRQTIEIDASHAEYSENSDIAVNAEPLLTSGCLPVTAGTTIPADDIDKSTWSSSSALRSNMPLPEERPSGLCSLPITEHPPKKQVPAAKKRWYALLSLCGTDDLDKAMSNVLYTQIGSNYRCHYCDRLIDSLEKVHCHLFYHNKVSLTACLHCKKTGSSRESVLKHTKQEHPNLEQKVNLLSVETTFIKTLNSEPLTLKRFKKVCKSLKNPNTDYLDEQSSCTESSLESAGTQDLAGMISAKGRKLLSGQKVNRTALSEDQEATKSEVESRQLLSEGQEVMRIKADFAQLSSENQETTKVKTEFSPHSMKLSVEPSHKGPKNLLESLSEAKQDDDNDEVPISGSSCSDKLPLVGEQALKKVILNSPLVNNSLSPLFEQASGVGKTSVYTCKVCSSGKVQFCSRYQIHRHLLEHLEVRPIQCCYCSFAAVEEHDVRLHVRKCHQDKPDRFKHVGVNLPDIVRNFIMKQKQNNSTSSTQDYFDENGSCGKRKDKSQADISLRKKAKKDHSSVKIKSWSKFRWNSSGHSSLKESKMKKHVLSSCTRQSTSHQETPCGASTSNERGLSQNAHASISEPSSAISCTSVSDSMHTEEQKEFEDEIKEVMYKCTLCSFQGHKIPTEEHIKTAHAYHNQLFKCGHCNMLYGNRVLLKNHTRSVHLNLPLKEEPLSWTMCYMELSPSKSSTVKYSQNTSDRISHTSPKRKAKGMQPQPKNYVKKMRQDLDADSDSEPVLRKHKSITKIKGKSLQAQIGSDDNSSDDFESTSASINLQSPRSIQKSSPPTKCEGASPPSVQNKHHSLFKAHSATQDHCNSPVQTEKQTFYRCGHCQETFFSKEEMVNHGKARHPTQLLSLEVHRHPATEMKTSQLPQESKEKSLQPKQFGASKAPKVESCSDLFDTEASILPMNDGLSVQCTDGIQCHLCHCLFSCCSQFSDHAAEIHFASTDRAHWQDVQSKGVYNSRGVLVALGSEPVVFKYLCAYCPTRGIHKHLMMQHQQEQHKDKSPWIIVLQSAASATQQTTKSCSRVEMKDTAAPRPQRKKHKYEIPEQELEVALTDVFTLDPLKFRNFLGANGVSALNMACLPRKTLFEVLKRGKRNP